MKHLILPISIFIFVISLICTNQIILKNLTNTLENDIDTIEKLVENEDFEKSIPLMKEFSEKYTKYNSYFSAVVRHNELDEIRLLVKRLEAYNKSADKVMFLAESNALKDMLCHIYKLDTINIENIL
ncbi:MAG: DUF4363 family protein [Clostridia bacterium]